MYFLSTIKSSAGSNFELCGFCGEREKARGTET